MKNKVSIVVPIYNVELFLPRCLYSILDQTYRNIEVICVNSVSTDNSATIVKQFMKMDQRFTLVNQSHDLGLGGARNEGLKYCTGEYVLFIDSDDWIASSMVERLVFAIQEYNVDYAFGAVQGYDNESSYYLDFEHPFHSIGARKKFLSGPVDFSLDPLLLVDVYPSAWLGLRKRKLIEKVNASFPECQIAEDHHFHYKYSFNNPKAVYVPEPFYKHRRNRNGQLSAIADERVLQLFTCLEDIFDIFDRSLHGDNIDKAKAKIGLRLVYEKLGQIDPSSDLGAKFFNEAKRLLSVVSREQIYLNADYQIKHAHIESIFGASRISLINHALSLPDLKSFWLNGANQWDDITLRFESPRDFSQCMIGVSVTVSDLIPVSLRLALISNDDEKSISDNNRLDVYEYRQTFSPGNTVLFISPLDFEVLHGNPSIWKISELRFGGFLKDTIISVRFVIYNMEMELISDFNNITTPVSEGGNSLIEKLTTTEVNIIENAKEVVTEMALPNNTIWRKVNKALVALFLGRQE